MIRLLIKCLCTIHNLSYRAIGVLVLRAENGIHPKHRIIRYYRFFLQNIPPESSVLDIGCGNGALAFHIAKNVQSVTAIDINRKNIRLAKQRFSRTNLHYLTGDATTFQFSETFDVITLSNVLEHIEHRIEFLRSISSIAPTILIRIPLITRDWLAVYKKEIGIEYRLDNTHFTEYTEESFAEEIHVAGLTLESSFVKFGELYAKVTVKKIKQ